MIMAIPPRQQPSANTGASAPQSPQRPAPKPPQGQQATPQQKGSPPPAKPGAEQAKPGGLPPKPGAPADGPPSPTPSPSPSGNTPNSPSGPKSTGPQSPSQGSPAGSPPGPPPLPEGPSPELKSAYEFLQNYVSSNMPAGSLPPQMLNEIDAETSQSVLNQMGSKIPTTITGAPKIFPKYSLAVGSPSSPNLPTGQNPPASPIAEPNLIAGLPKSQVRINQMKM